MIIRKIIVALLACSVYVSLSLIVKTPSYATTNAWWAWPGQKFAIYKQGWYDCSVGFPAMDHRGNHYFITAGHCFRSHDIYTHYEYDPARNWGAYIYSPNNPNQPVGWERAWANVMNNGNYLDISLVEMYQGRRIYGAGWPHIPNNIIYNPNVGDSTCLVGFNHDRSNCGVLLEKGTIANMNSTNYTWTSLDWATYCSHPGDSGGAVYNRLGALGINVSGDPNHNEPGTPGVCGSGFVPLDIALNTMREQVPDLYLV